MKDLILSIDVGTQSIRAIVFNAAGDIMARERLEIHPYDSPKPGWAEHDPEYFWLKLAETTGRLAAGHGADHPALYVGEPG